MKLFRKHLPLVHRNGLPPAELRRKPLPEWTRSERRHWEPEGYVWSYDNQGWLRA